MMFSLTSSVFAQKSRLRWRGLGRAMAMVAVAAGCGVGTSATRAATQAQPHPWAVRSAAASAAGSVSGKAPAVKGIEQGKVTLSNRGYVYTANFAADGTYRFPTVEAGIYALTTGSSEEGQALLFAARGCDPGPPSWQTELGSKEQSLTPSERARALP